MGSGHFANAASETLVIACTDGYWEHLSASEIASLLTAPDAKKILTQLANKSLSRADGQADNITVCYSITSRALAKGALSNSGFLSKPSLFRPLLIFSIGALLATCAAFALS